MSTSALFNLSKPINWSEPEYEAEGYFKPRVEEDFFNEAIPIKDLIFACVYEGKPFDCSYGFHPIITEAGVCYTFNKDGKLSTTFSSPIENLFISINVNEEDMTWSLQLGIGVMVSCEALSLLHILYKNVQNVNIKYTRPIYISFFIHDSQKL